MSGLDLGTSGLEPHTVTSTLYPGNFTHCSLEHGLNFFKHCGAPTEHGGNGEGGGGGVALLKIQQSHTVHLLLVLILEDMQYMAFEVLSM